MIYLREDHVDFTIYKLAPRSLTINEGSGRNTAAKSESKETILLFDNPLQILLNLIAHIGHLDQLYRLIPQFLLQFPL